MNPFIDLTFNDMLKSACGEETITYFMDTASGLLESERSEKEAQTLSCQLEVAPTLENAKELEEMKLELRMKDEVIKQLKQELKSRNFLNENRPSTKHGAYQNTDEVTLKARFIIQQFKIDQQIYQDTGKYDQVDERIAKIKEVFNLLLSQLNGLNSSNKLASKDWSVLKKLEVSQLLS